MLVRVYSLVLWLIKMYAVNGYHEKYINNHCRVEVFSRVFNTEKCKCKISFVYYCYCYMWDDYY